MSFAMLDLKAGTITNFTGLAKLVDTLGIGPDNQTVLVVHTPDPGSTASDPTAKATAQSQGYSVVNLPADMAQLVLTSQVPTQSFIFSNDALHAAVTLRDDTDGIYGIDAIDLQDLVVESLSLASAPEFAGPFAGDTPEVWVTQDFAAGRISFVNLATIAVSTATGYALNAGIGP